MKVLRYTAAAVVAGLFSQGALAACYVVYNADKEMVYRSPESPVDLSRPLHQTLPEVAPGGSLVFSLDSFGCEAQFNKLPTKSQAAKPAATAKKANPA